MLFALLSQILTELFAVGLHGLRNKYLKGRESETVHVHDHHKFIDDRCGELLTASRVFPSLAAHHLSNEGRVRRTNKQLRVSHADGNGTIFHRQSELTLLSLFINFFEMLLGELQLVLKVFLNELNKAKLVEVDRIHGIFISGLIVRYPVGAITTTIPSVLKHRHHLLKLFCLIPGRFE